MAAHDRDALAETWGITVAIEGVREKALKAQERVTRIELVSQAWKASALPLSYTREHAQGRFVVEILRGSHAGCGVSTVSTCDCAGPYTCIRV